jgi:ElaB/YqjD/DUF883 family membrane-anchored ribosome-binding protein
MTDADNRPTPKSPIADKAEDLASAATPQAKAFAAGTQSTVSGAARRTRSAGTAAAGTTSTKPLEAKDSVLLSGLDVAQVQGERLRKLVHERREIARERIREQPLAAVGVTFAAGLILGMLLARRETRVSLTTTPI